LEKAPSRNVAGGLIVGEAAVDIVLRIHIALNETTPVRTTRPDSVGGYQWRLRMGCYL
jgi:hypothetical protein